MPSCSFRAATDLWAPQGALACLGTSLETHTHTNDPASLALALLGLKVDQRSAWCSVSPQPLTAGGGDVVVPTAGVDGRLDLRLAALWGGRQGGVTSVSGGCSLVTEHSGQSCRSVSFLNKLKTFPTLAVHQLSSSHASLPAAPPFSAKNIVFYCFSCFAGFNRCFYYDS